MQSYDLFEQTQARIRMHKLALCGRMHVKLFSALHGRFIEEMRPVA